MTSNKIDWLQSHWKKLVWPVVILVAAGAAWTTQARWMPHAQKLMDIVQNNKSEKDDHEVESESAATTPPDTLTLSPLAWNNIGLVTGSVKTSDFTKFISVPAMVVERPGRSQNEITAPMTGVITQIYPTERQAIEPGMPLFEMRLTHEDVVTAQTDFLTSLQVLDVVNQELERLNNISEGVIRGKRIIEQRYERDKAMSMLSAMRQSLLLHGMSEQQIADMEETRKVLKDITVVAPPYAKNHEHSGIQHQYFVQSIKVNRGQSVVAGELMSVLADHCLLYIEGKAFEDDANRLVDAAQNGTTIRVVPVTGEYDQQDVLDLEVQSIANEVDMQSRALKFYLLLPNQYSYPDNPQSIENRFVAWKYRPGQRMEAMIPTSSVLKNKIVLPKSAVVIDGPNAFVFERNGNNFDRIDVQVLYRDKDTVVLEYDEQLIGSTIAMNGAYQMHLALKNQAGGAIDPHAGHNH